MNLLVDDIFDNNTGSCLSLPTVTVTDVRPLSIVITDLTDDPSPEIPSVLDKWKPIKINQLISKNLLVPWKFPYDKSKTEFTYVLMEACLVLNQRKFGKACIMGGDEGERRDFTQLFCTDFGKFDLVWLHQNEQPLYDLFVILKSLSSGGHMVQKIDLTTDSFWLMVIYNMKHIFKKIWIFNSNHDIKHSYLVFQDFQKEVTLPTTVSRSCIDITIKTNYLKYTAVYKKRLETCHKIWAWRDIYPKKNYWEHITWNNSIHIYTKLWKFFWKQLPVDILPVDILPVDILPVDILPVDILPVDILPVDMMVEEEYDPLYPGYPENKPPGEEYDPLYPGYPENKPSGEYDPCFPEYQTKN
jgi:hypothetical protein